jgi:hypothetical protein
MTNIIPAIRLKCCTTADITLQKCWTGKNNKTNLREDLDLRRNIVNQYMYTVDWKVSYTFSGNAHTGTYYAIFIEYAYWKGLAKLTTTSNVHLSGTHVETHIKYCKHAQIVGMCNQKIVIEVLNDSQTCLGNPFWGITQTAWKSAPCQLVK